MQVISADAATGIEQPLAIKAQEADGQRATSRTGAVFAPRAGEGLVKDPRGLQGSVEAGSSRGLQLTDAERAVVKQLSARDREVRDHEQAHARVGGQYAGEPTYTYQTGPDGQRYAVGGAVAIDTAPVRNDPQATIRKMEVVKAAALAPAEPSAADRRIAALAEAQKLQALGDLAELRRTEATEPESDDGPRLERQKVEAFLEALASLSAPVEDEERVPLLDLVA